MFDLINTMKSGWYSGKGFKAQRNGNHEDAIKYLELALEYSEFKYNPVIYDSMAFCHYNLKHLDQALKYAKRSIREYLETINIDHQIQPRVKALKDLVIRIQSENIDITKCSSGLNESFS
jgi:tetratricopeptide (TPR) repeat protein